MKSMNQEDFATEFNPLFTISNNTSLDNELKICKSENKQLQQKLNKLKEQISSKDKLLDSKSKHNLRLKQQIESLKKKLKRTKRSNGRNKKKQSQVKSKNKNKNPNNNKETNVMPYVIPRISTSISASSNLSAEAVSLSFPNNTKCDTNHKSNPSATNVLSPIAESNNSDSVPALIKTSNDNSNIHIDEWENCMAICEGPNNTSTDSHSVISYMTDNTNILLDMKYTELNKKSPVITGHNDVVITSPFQMLNPQTICNV